MLIVVAVISAVSAVMVASALLLREAAATFMALLEIVPEFDNELAALFSPPLMTNVSKAKISCVLTASLAADISNAVLA